MRNENLTSQKLIEKQLDQLMLNERERQAVLGLFTLIQIREYLQPTRIRQTSSFSGVLSPPNELDSEQTKHQF